MKTFREQTLEMEINFKPSQFDILADLREIIEKHPSSLKQQLEAVFHRGYVPLYKISKKCPGIYSIAYMPEKKIIRFQISHTERKKVYEAAWFVDKPEDNIEWVYTDLPF